MPFPYKGKIEVVCEECGKHVKRYPYLVKKFRFCSQKCKYSHIRRTMLRKRFYQRVGNIALTCQNAFCQKVFSVRPWEKSRKYCCKKCNYYAKSPEYKQRLEDQKIIQESLHKSIWRL